MAMAMAMAIYQDASFLGLPRELRLHIYAYICNADFMYCPITHWHDDFKTRSSESTEWGFRCRPVRDRGAKLQLPWLNLMSACKATHIEMTDYMVNHILPTQPDAADFVVDLNPVGQWGGHLGAVQWKAIQRPLERGEVLLANINARKRFRLWGDGGPRPIVRCLYQSLNLFIHCGPRMDPRKPLATPMHIRELIVNIRYGRSAPSLKNDDEDDSANEATFMRDQPDVLSVQLRKVVYTGILYGHVDRIRIKAIGWQDNGRYWPQEYTIEPKDPVEIPEAWDGYGFRWGLDQFKE